MPVNCIPALIKNSAFESAYLAFNTSFAAITTTTTTTATTTLSTIVWRSLET